MANISTIKEVILICRDARITPFIWGHRGLGKSSLVNQTSVEQGMGFIDLRCSQLEASDIRGLPDRGSDNRTHYLPPAEMPIGDMSIDEIELELAKVLGITKKDGDLVQTINKTLAKADLETERKYYKRLQELQPHFQTGILFIDEVNRAQDDVTQAVFQLVLDYKVGQYVLPPGWCIVAAGNFQEGYQVSGFNDPAFLDRFCHVTLSTGETTLEEWVNYMTDVHGNLASEVIEFASQNTKHLDGDIAGELGFSVQPSRRSWEMVTKIQKVCADADYSQNAIFETYAGLVGRELAQAFSRYSCPVKPRDLMKFGVKKYESKLKSLNRNQLTGLMWGLVSFAKSKIDEDDIAEVCLDFASFMISHAHDKDIVVAFCRALVSSGNPKDNQEKARAAVIANPRLANMISQFNKQVKNKKKTFVDRLTERPELQSALSKVSWGTL
jgi:hypothetical protein